MGNNAKPIKRQGETVRAIGTIAGTLLGLLGWLGGIVFTIWIGIVILNLIVPKIETNTKYNDIVYVSAGSESYVYDADIRYYRPLIPIWPFNTYETKVGDLYYDGVWMGDIEACINTDKEYFYDGKKIYCGTVSDEDSTPIYVRFDVKKLDFTIAK